MNTPSNLYRVYLEGTCEDCSKEILSKTKDAISYFNCNRCETCEAKMLKYMEETDCIECAGEVKLASKYCNAC